MSRMVNEMVWVDKLELAHAELFAIAVSVSKSKRSSGFMMGHNSGMHEDSICKLYIGINCCLVQKLSQLAKTHTS